MECPSKLEQRTQRLITWHHMAVICSHYMFTTDLSGASTCSNAFSLVTNRGTNHKANHYQPFPTRVATASCRFPFASFIPGLPSTPEWRSVVVGRRDGGAEFRPGASRPHQGWRAARHSTMATKVGADPPGMASHTTAPDASIRLGAIRCHYLHHRCLCLAQSRPSI